MHVIEAQELFANLVRNDALDACRRPSGAILGVARRIYRVGIAVGVRSGPRVTLLE
jgi:hypothetical protein